MVETVIDQVLLELVDNQFCVRVGITAERAIRHDNGQVASQFGFQQSGKTFERRVHRLRKLVHFQLNLKIVFDTFHAGLVYDGQLLNAVALQ